MFLISTLLIIVSIIPLMFIVAIKYLEFLNKSPHPGRILILTWSTLLLVGILGVSFSVKASGDLGFEHRRLNSDYGNKLFVSVYEPITKQYSLSLYGSLETVRPNFNQDYNTFLKTEVVRTTGRTTFGLGYGVENNRSGIRGSVTYRLWD